VKMMPDEGEVVAVASPTPGNAEAFAKRHGIPKFYADYRELLRDPAIELVSITAPNRLHAQITSFPRVRFRLTESISGPWRAFD